MNWGQRWCDLTVAQMLYFDRGMYVATIVVQTLLTVGGGWLFYRWRRRRDQRLAAEAIPHPIVGVPMAAPNCEAPSPQSPHIGCTRPLGHHPDVHWNETADEAWPVPPP